MRILLITSSFHPHKGGVETVVSTLARGLCSHGDRVVVVTNLWPCSLPIFEVVEGIMVIRVPMVLPKASATVGSIIKEKLTNTLLTVIMCSFNPDVVNVQCVGPNGHWGLILGQRFNVPIVVSTHGERTNDSSGFYADSKNVQMFQELIDSSKAIVCVSNVSAEESLVNCAVSPIRKRIIPNAISVLEVQSEEGARDIDISFVGRLVDEKGVDVLIKALATLVDSFPRLLVYIIGEGPSNGQLSLLVEESGLNDRVKFKGQLDRDSVTKVLLRSKVLVLPSRKESFGLVLLEAANAGCAVVATSVGGIPSIVEHGVNGLLFDVDSDKQLGRCLYELLSDDTGRLELVREFRNILPRYDIANFVTQYRSVFLDVAQF
jgi:glycogen(starch) synthase